MAKRSYNYVFTVNNYTAVEVAALDAFPAKFVQYGFEVGEKCGTPHLQGVICLRDAKSSKAMIQCATEAISSRGAFIIDAVKHLPGAILYTAKGEQPKAEWEELGTDGPTYGLNAKVVTRGVKPLTHQEKGENEKERAKRNLDLLMDDRIEDCDPDIIGKQLRNFQYGASELKRRKNMPVHLKQDPTEYCEWHWGVPRSGKTEYSYSLGPYYELSLKDENWDGYSYEDVVIFAEVDADIMKPWLVRRLKMWCDPAPFFANVKNHHMHIRPKRIIVTSNDPPEVCLRRCTAIHREAIIDRFRCYEWTERYYLKNTEKKLNPHWFPGKEDTSELPTPAWTWTGDPDL